MRFVFRAAIGIVAATWLATCVRPSVPARPETAGGSREQATPSIVAEASPAERARAGGWSGAARKQPRDCGDDDALEWCDGELDDDCDGVVDEGCVDCVNQRCERFAISEEKMRRGAGREGAGECVGPVYCGRIDGFATTSPPGGCGEFHCATVIWPDGTAQPFHCTIHGRCVRGEFVAKGFSW
jgi:hypothetical protein